MRENDIDSNLPETIIEPPHKSSMIPLREIFIYRELLVQLALRDISVRYKQTVLGFIWALINPVFTAIIFWLIFGIGAQMPTDGIPYLVFFLAGFILWNFFATSLSAVSDSMVNQSVLLKKVYFPRIIAPIASTAIAIIDYLIAMVLLMMAVIIFGFIPRWETFLIVLLVSVWLWFAAFSLGLWFAAFNVRYRDIGQIVPFAVRIGLFASPVIYPVSMIPAEWHWLYGLNPSVVAIEWLRWCLFDIAVSPEPVFFLSVVFILFVFIGGIRVFRNMEDTYADTV